MRRAFIAATALFVVLFALGFALGTIRVLFVAPRFGQLAATFAEVPVMLIAAFFACRLVLRHWQVPRATSIRLAMAVWFLVMLFTFETLLGATLFRRTGAEQWAELATQAGLLGLFAQIVSALLPVVMGRRMRE